MSEADQGGVQVRCTAVTAPGDEPPNVLFTPPCACPDCAPDRHYPDRSADGEWLRVRGDQQRHRVARVELGPRGRAALG